MSAPETPSAPEPPVRRFERVAARQPGAIAAEFAGQQLSYGELDRRANRLARYLLARGVGGGAPVAVCVPPSLDVVVAMLGIWKAGGAYVPLDPSYPEERLRLILDDTRASLLLAHGDRHEPLAGGPPRLCLDRDEPSLAALPDDPPAVELAPAQAASVFYTSGTTGRPKGVAASHANLAFYTGVARDRYGFSADDTFCSIARTTFSISLFELLSPLLCGGRLLLLERAHVLDPARLAATLPRVTALHAGPSLLRYLFRYLEGAPPGLRRFPGMRHASTGGDMVPPEILEQMKETFPGAELFVIYGCTEVNCMGCTFGVPRGQELRRTLVGRPLAGVRVRLVDEAGQGVPEGSVGEVLFAGPGVALGYLNLPALEAERFVWHEGERSYTTGDLGRLAPSGDLELLGRKDDQIQLHGIRIEPGEIEHALRQAPGVSEAAVAAVEGRTHEKTLVAFVVGEGLDGAAHELRRRLSERLPDYMVPTEFVVLDRLPLTANLKVDRKALPALAEARRAESEPRAAARGPGVDERVAGVFARFLGLDRVGLDDDFFDLGGHSLLALRVTDELNRLYDLRFPLHTLFQCPTPRAVARLICAGATPAPGPVPLNSNRLGPPVFMLAAVHVYRDLARELEDRFSVRALSIDPDPLAAGERPGPVRLVELAAEYAELLRRAQPAGAFRLAGYSFGGVLAFEVAQQLRRAGRGVERLWLLDSILPMQRGDALRVLLRFLRLPARQQGQVLAREARYAAQGYRDDQGPRAEPPPPDDRVRAMDELRTRLYLDAVKEYLGQIRPYAGPASLVVAGRRLAENVLRDPACGWSRHIGSLDVTILDAHHAELVSNEAAPRVAAVFRR